MSDSYKVFQELCQRNGIRPADVSRATGIATSTFTSWKQGVYEPKPEKLRKIAEYFGVSVEYMMSGENPDGYYYDRKTAELAQELYQNKDLHMLFDLTRDSSPEDLKKFYDMIMIMKRNERGDN